MVKGQAKILGSLGSNKDPDLGYLRNTISDTYQASQAKQYPDMKQ